LRGKNAILCRKIKCTVSKIHLASINIFCRGAKMQPKNRVFALDVLGGSAIIVSSQGPSPGGRKEKK
jgi:hypothetical protein